MMLDYQDLVNSTCLVLFEFQQKTFKAFNNQKEAIELYQAKEYEECFNLMGNNKVVLSLPGGKTTIPHRL